jgi:hypothetical protein
MTGVLNPSFVLAPIIKQLAFFPSVFSWTTKVTQQDPSIEGITDGNVVEMPVTIDLLLEFMLALLRMGLLEESSVRNDLHQFSSLREEEYANIPILNYYPSLRVASILLTDQEKEVHKQAGENFTEEAEDDLTVLQAIECNHESQMLLLHRTLDGIWLEPDDGSVSQTLHTKSMQLLSLLSRNPHILDLFHLHGLVPDLIRRTLRVVVQIFQNFNNRVKEEESEQDEHSDFSVALTVLYLIVERFEVIQCKEGRKVFEDLLGEAHRLYGKTTTSEMNSSSDMDRLVNWFRQWFYDAVPGERARDDDDDGMGGDGDKLLTALLNAQTTREQQQQQHANQMTDSLEQDLDPLDDNLLQLKNELSPIRILELSHYIAQQCLYVVAANRLKPLTVFSMLALFCEHFGNYVELGISLSLRTCLHHVFYTTQYHQHILRLMEELKDCLARQQQRPGKLLGTEYNIGSVLLHNIIKRHVHFVNQNLHDVTRNPSVLDYEKMQKFMKDEYTIVRNPALRPNVYWQAPLCQTPSSEVYQGTILIPMVTTTNSSSASTFTVPANSTTVSCLAQSSSYGALLSEHLDNLTREEFDLTRTESIVYMRQFYGTFDTNHLAEALLNHLYHTCGGTTLQQPSSSQTHQSQYRNQSSSYNNAGMRMADAVAMIFYIVLDPPGIEQVLQEHLPRFITQNIGNRDKCSTSVRLLLSRATAHLTAVLLTITSLYSTNTKFILDLITKVVQRETLRDRGMWLDEADILTQYLIEFTVTLAKHPEAIQEIFIGEEGSRLLKQWASLLKQKFGKTQLAIDLFNLRTNAGRQHALSLVLEQKTREKHTLNLY